MDSADELDYRQPRDRKDAMHDAVIGRQGRRRQGCACGGICASPARTDAPVSTGEAHYPAFVKHLAARERTLPAHVVREFEDYLKCGRLEHGFLRVRCADCHAERLVAFSCKRRGYAE